MPYKADFKENRKPWGMSDQTWELIQKAIADGKKVEWQHSSFNDPGDDWNKVLVDDECVFHQDGY